MPEAERHSSISLSSSVAIFSKPQPSLVQCTFIPDKELRPIVGKIAAELFRTKDIKSLNVNDRLILARKLRREYVSTIKQISRMLYLDAEILKGFI